MVKKKLEKIWKNDYHKFFYDFLKEYKREIKRKHDEWLSENLLTKEEKRKAMTECVHYIDDSESLPPNFSQSYLDLRYVFIVDENIHGLNPVIRKIFIEFYSAPSSFEKFLNEHPDFIHKAGYGMFFENYLKLVLWNSTNEEIILEKNDKISFLNFQHIFFNSFEKQDPNNMKYLEGFYEVYERILMTPKTENFPLFDFIEFNFQNKVVKFISVKTKPKWEIKNKDDLNFLLNPLKKLSKVNKTLNEMAKTLMNINIVDEKLSEENKIQIEIGTKRIIETDKNQIEMEKQRKIADVIDKLKNYCQSTREKFGIFF